MVMLNPIQTSINLLLKGGVDNSHSSEDEECEQIYGFLPCSYSAVGHLFLIVVYEYLLFHGESYVAAGGERIFKILGPGIFGASAFEVIGSLPEALILLGKLFVIDSAVVLLFSSFSFSSLQWDLLYNRRNNPRRQWHEEHESRKEHKQKSTKHRFYIVSQMG